MSLSSTPGGTSSITSIRPRNRSRNDWPAYSTREGYLPLDAFIDETMGLIAQKPCPAEILVQRVGPLRGAERAGRFDEVLRMVNPA